jgi:hypothetical protein
MKSFAFWAKERHFGVILNHHNHNNVVHKIAPTIRLLIFFSVLPIVGM